MAILLGIVNGIGTGKAKLVEVFFDGTDPSNPSWYQGRGEGKVQDGGWL